MIDVKQEHYRTGPGECACGWSAYKQRYYIYDYGDELDIHIRIANRVADLEKKDAAKNALRPDSV